MMRAVAMAVVLVASAASASSFDLTVGGGPTVVYLRELILSADLAASGQLSLTKQTDLAVQVRGTWLQGSHGFPPGGELSVSLGASHHVDENAFLRWLVGGAFNTTCLGGSDSCGGLGPIGQLDAVFEAGSGMVRLAFFVRLRAEALLFGNGGLLLQPMLGVGASFGPPRAPARSAGDAPGW